MTLKNLAIRTKIIIAFAIVLLTSIISGAVILTSEKAVEQNVGWTIHTYKVLGKVDAMMGALVDQETGLRGFLLTGKDGSLDPLRSGEKAFTDNWTAAKTLTSDNPIQQKRLEDIRQQVEEWQRNVSRYAIDLMKKPGSEEAAREVERSRQGKTYFGPDSHAGGRDEGRRASLLGARSDAMKAAENMILVSVIGSIVAILVFGFAAALILNGLIAVPLRATVAGMARVQDGDYKTEVAHTERKDEIGMVSSALLAFRDSLAAAEAARHEAAAREEAERQTLARRERLAQSFVANMQNIAGQFAQSSGEVAGSARNLSATAEETSRQAQAVAAAAEQAASNVQDGRRLLRGTRRLRARDQRSRVPLRRSGQRRVP